MSDTSVSAEIVVLEQAPIEVLIVTVAERGASGIAAEHGDLSGLADDDHTQYHTDARGDARYAPVAKGVTGGDAHDHNGGDGAQIAYASLSGLPTLGTAATAAIGDFEASGAVSTHNAVATAHGISAWGATLVDDADANTARSTLGLGTAATTASTAYEVAGAVGAHAGGTGVHTIGGVTGLQGALDAKAPTASPTFTGTVSGITKTMVGLGSVDNTSDAGKPVSTAQQTALNLKLDKPVTTNSALGFEAQYSLTTGLYNNAVGFMAQRALTSGNSNNATGANAQYSLTTGLNNNANGADAQRALTVGNNNNANGTGAQRSLLSGSSNTATGSSAQYALTTGSNNNATGTSAQFSLLSGSNNTATGTNAQYALTTGGLNNATGVSAQYSLLSGSSNTATGVSAQYALTTGSNNNATGTSAQYSLLSGSNNNATGNDAQHFLADGATAATVFSNCTHIGDGTRVSANSVTNETAIGSGAIGLGSNTCTIGNSSVTRTGLRGSVEVIAASSTTIAQSQAGVSASWVDSTHATRKARGILTAWDYSGGREAFRFEADGTQIKTSVNGVAAVARAAALTAEIPGDSTRDELRLTELYNACKAFGIIN